MRPVVIPEPLAPLDLYLLVDGRPHELPDRLVVQTTSHGPVETITVSAVPCSGLQRALGRYRVGRRFSTEAQR